MKKSFLIILMFIFTSLICFADVIIEAKKQVLKPETNKGYFSGDVTVQVGDIKVKSPRAELDLNSKTKKPSLATFFDNPYAFQEKGSKKHEIKADIIKVSLIKKDILAQGHSQSIILEDREPVVTVSAQSQEYDTKTKVMKAKDSVIINYEGAQTFSDSATAIIDNGGEMKHMELLGHVVMKEKENTLKGDKFVYEPSKEEYHLSGNTSSDVTFEDGSKVYLEANYQLFNKTNKTMIASGRVKVIYNDYVAIGPKAQLFVDEKTNKPSEIIFTGRSKITQGNNTVEADRIKLTLNPKAFYADGNVKTSIIGDNNDSMEFME